MMIINKNKENMMRSYTLILLILLSSANISHAMHGAPPAAGLPAAPAPTGAIAVILRDVARGGLIAPGFFGGAFHYLYCLLNKNRAHSNVTIPKDFRLLVAATLVILFPMACQEIGDNYDVQEGNLTKATRKWRNLVRCCYFISTFCGLFAMFCDGNTKR